MKSIIGFPNYLGQKLVSKTNSPWEIIKYLGISHSFYVDLSSQLNTNLYHNLRILNQTNQFINTRKINIGGDHSMAIATVADSLVRYPNLKVIWVDAHPDINTRDSSTSQSVHGMPLAFLSGLDEIPEIDYIDTKLKLSNLAYVGIRDIDDFEGKIIDSKNIKYFPVNMCESKMEEVILDLDSWIEDSPIHISWDVDSLDPEVIDSTGTPVPGGITLENGKKLFDFLLQKNWVNLDLTEVNLSLGDSEKSLANLKYLTSNLFVDSNPYSKL